MNRNAALTAGVCLVLAGGGSIWSGDAQAAEDDAVKERIEKRIEVVGLPGSSFLGVSLEEVEGDARGARVTSVRSESAAEKAGLEEGDVITAFDGETVKSARQLRRLVSETPPGRTVALKVQRDGAARTLSATLGEGNHWVHGGDHTAAIHMGEGHGFVPGHEDFDVDVHAFPHLPEGVGPHVLRWFGDGDHDFTMAWPGRPRLGIEFIELGDQLAEYFGLAPGGGVLVTAVEEGSSAARAGLSAGDVVVQLDGEAIQNGRDLQRRVREAAGGSTLTLGLQRKGRAVTVEVTLPEPEGERHRPAGGVSL